MIWSSAWHYWSYFGKHHLLTECDYSLAPVRRSSPVFSFLFFRLCSEVFPAKLSDEPLTAWTPHEWAGEKDPASNNSTTQSIHTEVLSFTTPWWQKSAPGRRSGDIIVFALENVWSNNWGMDQPLAL